MADLLIVDDDLDGAQALAELLELEGHQVRVGYNGEEGFWLAQQHTPEVAILDVEMPILDGPGMAYRLFVHDMGLEDVPIILLSGIPRLAEVASMVGTPYFHGKPYSYEEIVALLGRALSERTRPAPQPAADPDARG